MLDVIIFIVSAGPNVLKENLWETTVSLSQNMGDCNFKFYFVVDTAEMENFILHIYNNPDTKTILKGNNILEIVQSQGPWYKDYNSFFEKYKDNSKYFLLSHDDLTLNTSNLFEETVKVLNSTDKKVGWVSFTNDRYYRYNRMAIANSFKNPFSLDRYNHPRLYECHKFQPNQPVREEDLGLFDFPEKPVICCMPYTHLNFISADSLKMIGPCSEWTDYTILIDDDWGLEAIQKDLNNVWIPHIMYTHPNPKYTHLRKPGTDLRFEETAHKKFKEKWGFDYPVGDEKDKEIIEYVRKNYKKIAKFSYKNTYDWEFLS
jgi:hypothetical protein